MTPVDVLILGASGFGGGELLRLLHGHPVCGSVRGVSRSYAGQPLHAAHPNLRGCYQVCFDGQPDLKALAASSRPVIFSAMPHGALAAQLLELEAALAELGLLERCLLIDLSADFRLARPEVYRRTYGAHPCPERLSDFAYGLSEWYGAEIRTARRLANPGCFATALQLALLPLVGLGLQGFVAIDAKTGSSGSGATPSAGTHHPTRLADFRAYKMLGHRHQAELEMSLEQQQAPALQISFVPHSAPMVRGIFATLHVPLQDELPERLVAEAFERAYQGAPFVRLVEGSPRLAAVVGSNFCDLGWALEGRTLVVMAALDNLVKGMAGQAVQNLNLMLGLDPTTGLLSPGRYPC